MIQMIRVDYRLLHGQVAVSWTSALGADCILLVSDTVLNDKLRLQALSLAKSRRAARSLSKTPRTPSRRFRAV